MTLTIVCLTLTLLVLLLLIYPIIVGCSISFFLCFPRLGVLTSLLISLTPSSNPFFLVSLVLSLLYLALLSLTVSLLLFPRRMPASSVLSTPRSLMLPSFCVVSLCIPLLVFLRRARLSL